MPFHRFLLYSFVFSLLISACTRSSSNAYPTYDPFAPVGATNAVPGVQPGMIANATPGPRGPAPTRAPISVPLPRPNPNLPPPAPTPDAPHPLPAPRDAADQYTVQAGDTLASIAQSYGVTLDALMQANGLTDPNLVSAGVTLNIPQPETASTPGSSFKIIPDSELVFGPASIGFDIDAFLESQGGYLANYTQEVNGEILSGSQVIMRVAENYSVNPRLLAALLEYRSGWVTDPSPSNIDFPLGNYEAFYTGLYRQLAWAADNLNRGYYQWRANAIASLLLSDGTSVPLDPTVNAGTLGVQYFLALYNDRARWDSDVSASGLHQTYTQLFGSPFAWDVVSFRPPYLAQPPMRLPFEPGVTWAFTGGPHGGWDSGSGWAALDFAPPIEGMGCGDSDLWVTAAADGYIVRSADGSVLQDLDNDGYEQTGWTVLYMHIASTDRVPAGTYVYAGDRIGHPSCEGGISNATHLHIARRYNGEWIPADGAMPFVMDGWVSSGEGVYYSGYLTRGGVTLTAEEGVFEGINLISR